MSLVEINRPDRTVPNAPPVEGSFQIPKRLIQTGRTTELPARLKAAVAGLKALNADFDYRFFDNQAVLRFVHEEFPEYGQVFESFRFPIQRYDFFRYLAVYRLGGFYFDLDVFFCSGLDSLLSSGCVFPFEDLNMNPFLRRNYSLDWHIGNYAFGAAAGHPFLRAVIENCVRAQTEPQWAEPMMQKVTRLLRDEYWILNTTGPGLISRTLIENPQLAAQVEVLFPENVCAMGNWHHFGTFGVHLMEGTWRRHRGFLLNRLLLFWEAWKFKAFYRESQRLGPTRCNPGRQRELPGH